MNYREEKTHSLLMVFEGSMITGNKVILRDKRLADAQDDYNWQSDPELARLDATSVLTMTFRNYLRDYTDRLRFTSPTRRQFAIETEDGKHIGNCSYYGIDRIKGEVELGIMIGDRDYWNKGYGTDIMTTLVNYIFRETNLQRIHLKTLESNRRAQKCFQKCGFTTYGHVNRYGFDLMLMEIHHKQWQQQQTVE